ncbi:hypothetical protein LCGC14_1008560 [marine sediment metagenome]|uniref:Uncharacterized protein n=1 Tax=marine sediment metagenome TaxID=412755 RepID=A0A0F9QJ92_9ZZZZ
MSTYPSQLDSDVEIQRVDDNITEVGSDVINALRDAVFIIQKTLGVNPQGNKSTLTNRINTSIDANGIIKRSALESVGLVSLPITNLHVGTTAGIEETKLDLDHGTQVLKNLNDSMRIDLDGISNGLSALTSGFNLHILGSGNFHDGYHIKINTSSSIGVAGLEATTIGDALNEIGAILISGNDTRIAHIDTGIPSSFKHVSSKISVDATNFVAIDRTSTNVQDAIDDLDSGSASLLTAHVDRFHANGVLKEIDSGTFYNSRLKPLDSTSGVSYTEGTSVIKIPGVTSFFNLGIVAGDILEIEAQSGIADVGTYQIRTVGPLQDSTTLGDLPILAVDELIVFHVFVESRSSGDSVSVSIYKPAESSSEFAPLSCSVRNNETMVDTISVLNPDAARVVSIGFNGAILNTDGYEVGIKVGIGNQLYRHLVIPDLNLERLGLNQSNLVSATSVAERINAYVSDPDLDNHFPITAYRVGNELAIAHNIVGVDYTIEIADGYTGNYALGLDAYGADIIGKEIIGSVSNSYSINGTTLNTLKTVFDGYATITSDSSTFALWSSSTGQIINPLRYGIGAGSVMHITDHPSVDTNGSYTLLTADSTSVSLFIAEIIDAPSNPTTFDIIITSSNVSLDILESTESSMGLVQVFVDSIGQTFVHQRLIYGTSLGSAIEIINVSEGFPIGGIMLLVSFDNDFVNFNIVDDTVSGDTSRIHENFKGSFKLYHPNGLDYLSVQIGSGSIAGGIEDITIERVVEPNESLMLCTAHFNGTLSITNIIDNRLFGNLSTDQIRDDFVEIFSQRPVSDLRSNGVVRGFDLMSLLYVDSITDMQAIPLRGGIAYVNGVRVSVETQKVIIQSYDEEGTRIVSGNRIVGINDFGSIQVLSDELGEILTDGYNASADFGKILPLYSVVITNGVIGNIVDIRRFINNIDEKLDMVVDESNNIVGNFRSLEGALLYAEKYPGKENLTIKIVNSVFPDNPLIIPDGVSIIGGAAYGGNSKHQIINTINHNQDFLTFMGNNRLENVEVLSTTSGLQGALISIDGPNVNVEKCLIGFGEAISSNSSDIGIKIEAGEDVRVVNNRINNVYTGVSSETGCDNLVVSENNIDRISGVGLSCGIKIGTSSNSVNNIEIFNNKISLSNTPGTDIRGIFIDIDNSIQTLKINGNNIIGELNQSSENNVSNGIRITNVSASGNKITQLVMIDNYVTNVKLRDSSVFGIFIEDVQHALVAENTVTNVAVYDANYTDTALIWVEEDVDAIEINNNMLGSSAALRGIYINNTSTLVSIIGNTLDRIGDTDAMYIYGTSHRANVSDNKLIGPGNTGIWWKGERSKISSNHLSTPDNTTDYAFTIGIKAQASYVDVVNNTMTDMVYDGSIGIMSSSSANDGMKVLGNTIEGTKMGKLIELNGNYNVVSGNRLKNDLESLTGDSMYVDIVANTDGHSIIGNTFEGIGTACIYSSGKVTNSSILNNLVLTTTLTSAPIRLADSGVVNCLVMGNRLPARSTYSAENVVGPIPTSSIENENTIGVNRGMLDTRGLHASAGVTGYDSDATVLLEYAHWIFNDAGSYWEVNSTTTSDDRYLYFPIYNLPNGSILKSAEVQGKNVVQSGDVFDAQIFKRSANSPGTASATVSIAKDMSAASGNFGNGSDSGLIDESSSGVEISEVINYVENNYYVRIKHSKASPDTPTDIRIYGVTVSFRY